MKKTIFANNSEIHEIDPYDNYPKHDVDTNQEIKNLISPNSKYGRNRKHQKPIST